MSEIYLPTLLFWENGNSWYGSDRAMRFFIRPVKPSSEEEGSPRFEAELWRGPLTKELSEIDMKADFPLDEGGISELTAWLEQQSARYNGTE